MGAVFRFLMSFGKTYFLLPCGAILYASSELWRLDLFRQGTFTVWFVVGIGLPASILIAEHLRKMAGPKAHLALVNREKMGFSDTKL
jgi:hypothetical protein